MLPMLKGSKVMFVPYVHNIDTFNAMSKGPKDNFLNIQPIFNQFSNFMYVFRHASIHITFGGTDGKV